MMVFKKGVYFLADTTVTIDPTPEELAVPLCNSGVIAVDGGFLRYGF